MTEIEKINLNSLDIKLIKSNELQNIFPEIYKDGKIDLSVLEHELGEWVDLSKERYGLNWSGKANCIRVIQQPSIGTLLPQVESSLNFSESTNLIIEGDNLEALKILQKSYYNKVGLIYIDPPYNTGKEFIYPDNFQEGLKEYLKRTHQVDGNGFKLSANTETDGRFHTNWLNMMYPRLYLARNLLKDDGVIFVSIDDNEIINLKFLLNEIFGEENVEIYVWDVREDGAMPKTAKKTVRKEHEYLVAAFKNRAAASLKKYGDTKYADNDNWGNSDNDPRGPWMSGNISRNQITSTTGEKYFTIKTPKGNEFSRNWTITKEEYQELFADNRIYFANDGEGVPRRKIFKNEPVFSIQSSIFENLGSSQSARKSIEELLPGLSFDYPKPVPLIKRIIKITTSPDDYVLDFFAGSGTTGEAVIEANAEDEGSRKYILIQLPEKIEHQFYKTVFEITKARLKAIHEKKSQDILYKTLPSLIGFKSFKLDSSNFLVWNNESMDLDKLSRSLELFAKNVDPTREPLDLLYEILLKSGFTLDSKFEISKIDNKEIYSIEDGGLLICLEKELSIELIEKMLEFNPFQIICLDEGFKGNDQLKVNVIQTIKSRQENEDTKTIFRVV